VAEEYFELDDQGQRSAFSGELGSPSTTWMGWLAADSDVECEPGFHEVDSYDAPVDAGIDAIYEYPATPFDPWDTQVAGAGPPDARAQVDSSTDSTTQRSLFDERYAQQPWDQSAPYSGHGTLMPPSPSSSFGAESDFRRAPRRHSDGYTGQFPIQNVCSTYFHADLQQRRLQDERLTGRRWPGNGIPYPGSPREAIFFDQLAIALGEVDPRTLARESALRYVRASRRPGEDALGPTDIYAIFYYGLGLSLRPLDCAGLPHVLATYSRLLHEVYLDWTLLKDPPYGRATLDQTAWRRTLDNSPLARILLAWCAATHLAENYDMPLVLGFSGYSGPLGDGAQALPGVGLSLSPAGMAGDVLNRYRKTILAFANLLAPQERLWQQINALHLGIPMGDSQWRAHVRTVCSLEGSSGGWRQVKVAGHLLPGGFWYPHDMDPVEQLITILAERNSCPPSLIAWQLDGNLGTLDWDAWSMQLLRDIPALQQRYALAEQFLYSGMSRGAGWPMMGLLPDSLQLPPLRLSF
jgi:hypothetical protein